jgi:hypothetical protein
VESHREVTTGLKIARGFTLPIELVTEATAIVATRGAGKSSGSAVIVEEAFALGVQSVIFDRTGVYHGLRSNANGDGPGLPIYVLGGPHGDVPLESHAGALIANLVVDSGHSFVLDLSDFSKSAAIKFAADFLERLYDRKARSRSTLLLVMDEAHFYAPQTPRGGFKGDSARLMGAMEDVVGLGRSRGLGVVLTTQRTQALNKAILDLIETLLVMRMLSPRARDAVQDWIREKHEDDREGVIGTLDSLPTGTAWVWSPLRGILQKLALRRIKTFDSYETPKPGQQRTEPSVRQELDLDALGDEIRRTAERAKENDPAELRKRLRAAEAALEERASPLLSTEDEPAWGTYFREQGWLNPDDPDFAERVRGLVPSDKVEVSALTADDRSLLKRLAGVDVLAATQKLEALASLIERAEKVATAVPASEPVVRERPRPAEPTVASLRRPVAPARQQPETSLGKGERKVLGVLAEFPDGRTSNELAFLAGYSARASTIGVILSGLRKAGLVHPGQPIRPTEAGLAAVGGPVERPTGPDLLEAWLQHPRVGIGERRVLLALVDAYPDALPTAELADRTGYSSTASTIGVILSNLRKLGLVQKSGARLSDEFAEAIR